MATSEPWITLGRSYDASLDLVRDPAREVHVAFDGGDVVGFVGAYADFCCWGC